MFTSEQRFEEAVAQIDAAHGNDPDKVEWEGSPVAAELLYSRRMSHWLERIEPAASEALRLAVRCQHLCRWTIPRSDFPMTRAGYHQWRTTLSRFHAEKAGEILHAAGYDAPLISRVQSLIRKERLKSDPETQALEDAACLVFLEGEYVDFARGHDPQKIIEILRKTWKKMSDRGHAAALALAQSLPDPERALIVRAVSGE